MLCRSVKGCQCVGSGLGRILLQTAPPTLFISWDRLQAGKGAELSSIESVARLRDLDNAVRGEALELLDRAGGPPNFDVISHGIRPQGRSEPDRRSRTRSPHSRSCGYIGCRLWKCP